jgi:hypothetical protein
MDELGIAECAGLSLLREGLTHGLGLCARLTELGGGGAIKLNSYDKSLRHHLVHSFLGHMSEHAVKFANSEFCSGEVRSFLLLT